MSRKTAREVAMMLTYEKMFGCDDNYYEVLEKSGIIEEPTEADIAYATAVVEGVQNNIEEIDRRIEGASKDWTVSRMPKVDLSIMRNAAYEVLFIEEISDAISINEAVELAKIYCDDKSPKFINGLLGQLVRNKDS